MRACDDIHFILWTDSNRQRKRESEVLRVNAKKLARLFAKAEKLGLRIYIGQTNIDRDGSSSFARSKRSKVRSREATPERSRHGIFGDPMDGDSIDQSGRQPKPRQLNIYKQ